VANASVTEEEREGFAHVVGIFTMLLSLLKETCQFHLFLFGKKNL
jgi:hypothetical protein